MTQSIDPTTLAAYRLADQANRTATAQSAAIAQINRNVADLTDVLTKDRLSEEHTKLAKQLEADVEAGRISREQAIVQIAEAVAESKAVTRRAPQPQPVPQVPQINPIQVGAQAILASYGLRGNEAGLALDTTNPQTFRRSIEAYVAANPPRDGANQGDNSGDKKDDKTVDVDALRAQLRRELSQDLGIPLRDGGGAPGSVTPTTVTSDDVQDIVAAYNNRFHSTKPSQSRGQTLRRLQEARDQLASKVAEVQTNDKTYAATPENLARIAQGGNPR